MNLFIYDKRKGSYEPLNLNPKFYKNNKNALIVHFYIRVHGFISIYMNLNPTLNLKKIT